MYLIGRLDQWKWAVSPFDCERAKRGDQPTPAERRLRWVHQCLAVRHLTYCQVGALVGPRLGENARDRATPMPKVVPSRQDGPDRAFAPPF
jgi:hypothetical protein